MRRADRLFDIIQMLRVAVQPMTAAMIAERLEVTVRTVYRDIATLQARRIPIEGAPGLGYLLRRGFDLPPLMFTADEVDAIAVGARLVRRLRDPGLQSAAESVLAKVTTALPDALRSGIMEPPFLVSSVAKYMAKRHGPPSQGWSTFLRNHAPDIAAMDLFVVPTINFNLLYALVIIGLDRRDLIWINVTTNATAEWIARQLTEAFP
ncbi:MAG: HTH domain-containing protein, partial [Pseudolabrys sp.]